MDDMDDVVSALELQIRWIEGTEYHQFPGWRNVVGAMRYAIEHITRQNDKIRSMRQTIEELYLGIRGR